MTRRTFIKRMKKLGFELKREGNSWFLKKPLDGNTEVVLFLKKERGTRYTDSFDNPPKEYVREWCDFKVWENPFNSNRSYIGGDFNYLPFNMVEKYLAFFIELQTELLRI